MGEMTASVPSGIALRHACGFDELAACFPMISALRPGLGSRAAWAERATQMADAGYRVLAAWEGRRALAVAGYRTMENLVHGHFLYVDDLVSIEDRRGRGLGAALLAELATIGTGLGCGRLVLDTLATNAGARRFYARQGMADLVVGFVKGLGER